MADSEANDGTLGADRQGITISVNRCCIQVQIPGFCPRLCLQVGGVRGTSCAYRQDCGNRLRQECYGREVRLRRYWRKLPGLASVFGRGEVVSALVGILVVSAGN